MEKEVYLLCPNCKGITNGTGSGDYTDMIWCCKCKSSIKARQVCMGVIADTKKPLYIEEDRAGSFVE